MNTQFSEIFIEEENMEKVKEKLNTLNNYIKKNGFKGAAVKFSSAESSNQGGILGWINQSEISQDVAKVLKKLKIGEISEPINVPLGFMILKLNDKKTTEKKIDVQKLLKQLNKFEKNKQLNVYSLKHYTAVKNSLLIKYYNE